MVHKHSKSNIGLHKIFFDCSDRAVRVGPRDSGDDVIMEVQHAAEGPLGKYRVDVTGESRAQAPIRIGHEPVVGRLDDGEMKFVIQPRESMTCISTSSASLANPRYKP